MSFNELAKKLKICASCGDSMRNYGPLYYAFENSHICHDCFEKLDIEPRIRYNPNVQYS